MTRPVIGLHYEEQRVLRSMPRHWRLEEAQKDSKRWHWWRDTDAIVLCVVLAAFFVAQVIA